MSKRKFCVELIALVLILGFSFTACDDGGGGRDPVSRGRLQTVDIVGAQMLTLAPSNSPLARSARNARNGDDDEFQVVVLLKLLDNGEWVQVTITDEEGTEVHDVPKHILEVAEGWMAMVFPDHDPNRGHEYWGYLINKSDGRAYDITGRFGHELQAWRDWSVSTTPARYIGHPVGYAFGNNSLIATSFRTQINRGLLELVLGYAQGTSTWITPEDFNVRQFAVDSNGNTMYDMGDYFIVRTVGGQPIALRDHPVIAGMQGMVVAIDGIIYFLGSENSSTPVTLYTVDITGTTPESVTFTPISIVGDFFYYPPAAGGIIRMRLIQSPDRSVLFNGDAVLNLPRTGNPTIVQLQESFSTNSIRVLSTANQSIFLGLGPIGSNRLDQIVEINLNTGAVTDFTLPADVAWAVNFEISGNGIVTADARTLVGSRRLIQRAANGTWQTIREDIPQDETVILVRVR